MDGQVGDAAEVVNVREQEGVERRVVPVAGDIGAVGIDRHRLEEPEFTELVQVENREAETVELRRAGQFDARIAGRRDVAELEDEIIHVVRAVHCQAGERRVAAQDIHGCRTLTVGEVQLVNHRIARRDGETQRRVGRGEQRVKADAVVHASGAQRVLEASLQDDRVDVRDQVLDGLIGRAILAVRHAGQNAERHVRTAIDAHAELEIRRDAAIERRIRRTDDDGLARDVAVLELQRRERVGGVRGVRADLD